MTGRENEIEHQKFSYDGHELVLCKTQYESGQTAIIVREAMSGDPWAAMSIAIYDDPAAELPEGEFWLKTYSENEELANALLGLGVIELTGSEYQLSPWAIAYSAKLA